jgi:uncharacterized phage-associated protein
MIAKSLTVAKRIADNFANNQQQISIRKLNILTYICHGVFLAKYEYELLQEPVLLDWTGPKINSLSLCDLGNFPVFDDNLLVDLDSKEIVIISDVIENYADVSTVELVQSARLHRTPWSITWNFYKNRKIQPTNVSISNDLIKHHYRQILTKRHYCGI